MCDCSYCNADEFDGDAYLEYEYNKYCTVTINPLPMSEWLKQYESPIQK